MQREDAADKAPNVQRVFENNKIELTSFSCLCYLRHQSGVVVVSTISFAEWQGSEPLEAPRVRFHPCQGACGRSRPCSFRAFLYRRFSCRFRPWSFHPACIH